MFRVAGVILVERVLRVVGVLLFAARVVVAVMVVAVFAVRVLVAVVPFAVVNVLGRVGISGSRR